MSIRLSLIYGARSKAEALAGGFRPELPLKLREHTPPDFCTWLVELARRCKLSTPAKPIHKINWNRSGGGGLIWAMKNDKWISFAYLYKRKQGFTPGFTKRDQITVFVWRFMRMFKKTPTVANFDIFFEKFAAKFYYSYSRYQGRFSYTFLDRHVEPDDILEPDFEYGHCTGVSVDFKITMNRRRAIRAIEDEKKEAERQRIHAILHPPPKPTHEECKGCGKTVKSNSLKPCYIRGNENNGYKCMSCWNKTKPLAKLVDEIYEIKSLTNKLQKIIREKNHGKPNQKHHSSTSQNAA